MCENQEDERNLNGCTHYLKFKCKSRMKILHVERSPTNTYHVKLRRLISVNSFWNWISAFNSVNYVWKSKTCGCVADLKVPYREQMLTDQLLVTAGFEGLSECSQVYKKLSISDFKKWVESHWTAVYRQYVCILLLSVYFFCWVYFFFYYLHLLHPIKKSSTPKSDVLFLINLCSDH